MQIQYTGSHSHRHHRGFFSATYCFKAVDGTTYEVAKKTGGRSDVLKSDALATLHAYLSGQPRACVKKAALQ